MPWCEPCNKFYNPGSLTESGACPVCETELDIGHVAAKTQAEVIEAEAERAKVPWHFWVGVVAMSLYLGWRLIQGILLLF